MILYCPKCGGQDLTVKKFSDTGINLHEYYCCSCFHLEEEWDGIADAKIYQLARAHDDFDAFLKIRKAILKEKPNESLLLQLNATLAEQNNKKNMPVFHKYIFWVIVSLKNLVSLERLQKHLLEHLYYDQEWLERDEQFFLEIAFVEKQKLTPISEDEKAYMFHYLAFSADTLIVLTREGFEREWNFKLNPKK